MTGKKVFEVLKLLAVAGAVFIFVRFIADIRQTQYMKLAVDIIFYTAIADVALNFLLQLLFRAYPLSSISFVTLLWFAFVKLTGVIDLFMKTYNMFEEGMIVVIVIISIVILILYAVRAVSIVSDQVIRLKTSPYFLIALSFLILIFIGAVLLYLPVSQSHEYKPLSIVDAVFTATSAVCVTGLTVQETGTFFSRFGQIVILTLIQIGGLGIMTFGAFFAQLIGQKTSYHSKYTLQNAVNEMKISGTGRYIVAMILTTFTVELIGAGLMFIRFVRLMPAGEAVYYSLFHSVSAFCNAGFGLYSDSLTIFRSDLLVNFAIMGLIVMGGIGFSVIVNVSRIIRGKTRFLTLHSKLVIVASSVLIVFGALSIFLLEHNGILKGLGIKDSILASFFTSITSRTAGFNTIDVGLLKPATLILIIMLMFIGASPGSTGGGIKTTTFSVVASTVLHTLRERPVVTVIDREVPLEIIRKAMTIFILALTWILFSTIIISYFESFSAERIAFEVVSAFGTVGLSTGITPQLSTVSKAVLIMTMFIGRVGPLTLIASIGFHAQPSLIRRPEERILIG